MNHSLLVFTGLAVVLTITPGADMLLVTRNVISFGRRAGLLNTIGMCTGCVMYACAAGIGISQALARAPLLFSALKASGGMYLMLIGALSVLRSYHKNNIADSDIDAEQPQRAATSAAYFLIQGLMTNLLNPNVALFYILLLPSFIRAQQPVFVTSVLLGSIHAGLALVWLSTYSVTLSRLAGMVGNLTIRKWLERLSGILLFAFGAKFAS
jgi:threonine/homoserine/homoserine lactone efflux protein